MGLGQGKNDIAWALSGTSHHRSEWPAILPEVRASAYFNGRFRVLSCPAPKYMSDKSPKVSRSLATGLVSGLVSTLALQPCA